MKQLPLSKLQSLFAAVSAAQKLYIPADDAAGQASFTVWQEGIALTKMLRLRHLHNPKGFSAARCFRNKP